MTNIALCWSDRLRQRVEARLLSPTDALGRKAEDLAHRYLKRNGFMVVQRRWRMPGTLYEVDLIALDGEQTVLVEVKGRSSIDGGDPERNVDAVKLLAMRRAAAWYGRINRVPEDHMRLDLVTVVMGEPPNIRHIRDYATLHG